LKRVLACDCGIGSVIDPPGNAVQECDARMLIEKQLFGQKKYNGRKRKNCG
jgi:hypothetical protein